MSVARACYADVELDHLKAVMDEIIRECDGQLETNATTICNDALKLKLAAELLRGLEAGVYDFDRLQQMAINRLLRGGEVSPVITVISEGPSGSPTK